MNNFNDFLTVTEDNYINSIVYEEDAFKLIFPNCTEEDYIKTLFARDYPYEAITYAEDKYNKNYAGIRFILINKLFFSWCEEFHMPLNLKSVHKYANYFSDNYMRDLWNSSKESFDLVLCALPILVKYYYDETKYLRYYKLTEGILEKSKIFLGELLNLTPNNIHIHKEALTKSDAILNLPYIEEAFLSEINGKVKNHTLIKSIYQGYKEDFFMLKYIICGIKVDRHYKMSKAMALKDGEIEIDKLFLQDEMLCFSEVLSEGNEKYYIYPVFDRLINVREIEASEEMLQTLLPQLLAE